MIPPATSPIVSLRGLRKTYNAKGGEVKAVDGIDLDVQEGQIYGLLGPNGAGKTTTISIATTRVIPTAGSVHIAGVDVVAHPADARRYIGVVPQYNTLDRACTVEENIQFHCLYFGMSRADGRTRTEAIARAVPPLGQGESLPDSPQRRPRPARTDRPRDRALAARAIPRRALCGP